MNNKTMLKLAILAVSFLVMGAGVSTPALADIMKAFPLIDPTTIMLIASIPSLVIILVAPIYGRLTLFVSKRVLLFFAIACFLVGGFVPALLNDFYLVLAMRCVLGISLGIIMPMASDLVADYFDGHERESMMGWQSAVASIGGILFQLAGGFLAAINWHYAFYAYLVAIVIFIFTFIYLPKSKNKQTQVGQKAKVPGKVYAMLAVFFLYNMFFFAFITNTAVVIVGGNLGNAGNAGIAFTLMTVGSFIGGLSLGKIMKAIKSNAVSLGYLFTALGFVICYFATSIVMIYVGAIVLGIGLGVTIPAYWVKISVVAPPAAVAIGISIGISAMNIGDFVQPYVYAAILNVFHQQIGKFPYAISMVGLLIILVITLLTNFMSSNSNSGNEINETRNVAK